MTRYLNKSTVLIMSVGHIYERDLQTLSNSFCCGTTKYFDFVSISFITD